MEASALDKAMSDCTAVVGAAGLAGVVAPIFGVGIADELIAVCFNTDWGG